MLKSNWWDGGGWVAPEILVTNFGLELGWTGLGLGQGGLGTKVSRPWLKNCRDFCN